MSTPPPFGVYVPAVVFLDENEELDLEGIRSHVLRLAQVQIILLKRVHGYNS